MSQNIESSPARPPPAEDHSPPASSAAGRQQQQEENSPLIPSPNAAATPTKKDEPSRPSSSASATSSIEPPPAKIAKPNPAPTTEGTTAEQRALISCDTCGVCNGVYSNKTPILLGCLHVFCSKCILFRKNLRYGGSITPRGPKDVGKNFEGVIMIPDEAFESYEKLMDFLVRDAQMRDIKMFIKCPACDCLSNSRAMRKSRYQPCVRKDIILDVNLKEESSTQEQEEEHDCTSCDEPSAAISYCEVCEEKLCQDCVKAHKRVKLTKDHKLIPVKDTKGKDASACDPSYFKCEHHPTETLKLYCETCSQLTCRDCQLTHHRDHRYKFVEEAAGLERQLLESLKSQFVEKGEQLAAHMDSINKIIEEDKVNVNIVVESIEYFADQLITAIRKKSDALVQKSHAYLNKSLEKQSSQLNLANRLKAAVVHSLNFIDMAMKPQNGVALLHSKTTVVEYLHTVLRQSFNSQTIARTELTFVPDGDIHPRIQQRFGVLDRQSNINRMSSAAASSTAAGIHHNSSTSTKMPPLVNPFMPPHQPNSTGGSRLPNPSTAPPNPNATAAAGAGGHYPTKPPSHPHHITSRNSGAPMSRAVPIPRSSSGAAHHGAAHHQHHRRSNPADMPPHHASRKGSAESGGKPRYGAPITNPHPAPRYPPGPPNMNVNYLPGGSVAGNGAGGARLWGPVTSMQQQAANKRLSQQQQQQQLPTSPTTSSSSSLRAHNIRGRSPLLGYPPPTGRLQQQQQQRTAPTMEHAAAMQQQHVGAGMAKSTVHHTPASQAAKQQRNSPIVTSGQQLPPRYPSGLYPHRPPHYPIHHPHNPSIPTRHKYHPPTGFDPTRPPIPHPQQQQQQHHMVQQQKMRDEMRFHQQQREQRVHQQHRQQQQRQHQHSSDDNPSPRTPNSASSLSFHHQHHHQHANGGSGNVIHQQQEDVHVIDVNDESFGSDATPHLNQQQRLRRTSSTSSSGGGIISNNSKPLLSPVTTQPSPSPSYSSSSPRNLTRAHSTGASSSCSSSSRRNAPTPHSSTSSIPTTVAAAADDLSSTGGAVNLSMNKAVRPAAVAAQDTGRNSVTQRSSRTPTPAVQESTSSAAAASDDEEEGPTSNDVPPVEISVDFNLVKSEPVDPDDVDLRPQLDDHDDFPTVNVKQEATSYDEDDDDDDDDEASRHQRNKKADVKLRISIDDGGKFSSNLSPPTTTNNQQQSDDDDFVDANSYSDDALERDQEKVLATLIQAMPICHKKPDDPNEDYCAVCHNGGDLLCCDNCPKVFHLACHVPDMTHLPLGKWMCTFCRDFKTVAGSHANGEKKSSRRGNGLNGKDLKLCEKIVLFLFCHPRSEPFHRPVKSSQAPNYYKVIATPMDLSKIKKKMSGSVGMASRYENACEMISDIVLMLNNCIEFNGECSELGMTAYAIYKYFKGLVHGLLKIKVPALSVVRSHIPTLIASKSRSSDDEADEGDGKEKHGSATTTDAATKVVIQAGAAKKRTIVSSYEKDETWKLDESECSGASTAPSEDDDDDNDSDDSGRPRAKKRRKKLEDDDDDEDDDDEPVHIC